MKKDGLKVEKTLGVVFTTLGTGFLVGGVAAGTLGGIIGLPFFLVGGTFAGIGGWMLKEVKETKQVWSELKEKGYLIYAQVVSMDYNQSITLNGRHPYVLKCEYENPDTGKIYTFTSEDFYSNPIDHIESVEVPVYVDSLTNPKYYYVDVSAILETSYFEE